MKIGIDIRDLANAKPTGVDLYTCSLITHMAALAPHDTFILFASGTNATLDLLPKFEADNIVLDARIVPNKLLAPLFVSRLGPALDDIVGDKPDLWFFPNPNIVRTSLPYAMTVHDIAHHLLPEFFPWKYRLRNRLASIETMAKRASRIFTVSQSTSFDLQTEWSIPESVITVTPLGVDHERYGVREQPSDRSFRAAYDLNRPYILSLSTLEPRKNLSSVVEAYSAFRARGGVALPLVIAGGRGWKNQTFDEAFANSPYRDDVRILGYVPDRHKPALYRGASVFVFASFYEGFGLPVLEAMACGAPVITSFTSSLPEVVGDAGILIDPFNVTDIRQALEAVLGEGGVELRRTLSERSYQRAQSFTWQKTAEMTLAGLREVFASTEKH